MERRDVVIVGAGPAGLAAAIFTQLDGWNTLVLEGKWPGGQGAIAFTVSNYPGFLPADGQELAAILVKQATAPPPAGAGAELRQEKAVRLRPLDGVVETENNAYVSGAVILATGSAMQGLGVPGEVEFTGRGVSYYARRDLEAMQGQKVMVVGGGNTTAKSALLAKTVASQIILVHRREALRAYPGMVKRLQNAGIAIWYNTEVKAIKGTDKVEAVDVVDNRSGEVQEVATDWVVICIGTEPDTTLAREVGLTVPDKFIEVDGRMMTSVPGIFACGEIAGSDRHLISAAASGAAAGMAASEYLAQEKVRRGEMFTGAVNGKYADEYLALLRKQ